MKTETLAVDPDVLREEVRNKYRDVACNPHGQYHFHTGRPLAQRLGYDHVVLQSMAFRAKAGKRCSRTLASSISW